MAYAYMHVTVGLRTVTPTLDWCVSQNAGWKEERTFFASSLRTSEQTKPRHAKKQACPSFSRFRRHEIAWTQKWVGFVWYPLISGFSPRFFGLWVACAWRLLIIACVGDGKMLETFPRCAQSIRLPQGIRSFHRGCHSDVPWLPQFLQLTTEIGKVWIGVVHLLYCFVFNMSYWYTLVLA